MPFVEVPGRKTVRTGSALMQKRITCERKKKTAAESVCPARVPVLSGCRHRYVQLLLCPAAPGRRRGGGQLVAPQPCPAVRKPAVDRGGVYRLLSGRRAILGAVEVRRRAGSDPPCRDDRRAHRRGVCGEPPFYPRCAVQFRQLHGLGAHLFVHRRQPLGLAAVFEPSAG